MPKSNAIGAILASLLIFLTLGHQKAVNAETTFTINKSNTTATAIVNKQELKVKIETMPSDYENDLDKKLNFELVVGDCVLPIKAYEDGEGLVVFNVAQSLNKLSVFGPTLLTAAPSQISFEGTSTGKPIPCKVKFEMHPDDEKKFLIKLELKGDKIPENLNLILTDPIFNEEDKADGFNIWIVLGPLIGVVSLIVLIGLVAGVALFRRYEKRKNKEPQQTPTFVVIDSAKDKPIQSSASKREIAQSETTKSYKKEQKPIKAKKSKESGDKKQVDQLQMMEQKEKKPNKTSEEQLTHFTCEEYDFVAEQRRQNEERRKALEAEKQLSEATQEEGLIDN